MAIISIAGPFNAGSNVQLNPSNHNRRGQYSFDHIEYVDDAMASSVININFQSLLALAEEEVTLNIENLLLTRCELKKMKMAILMEDEESHLNVGVV